MEGALLHCPLCNARGFHRVVPMAHVVLLWCQTCFRVRETSPRPLVELVGRRRTRQDGKMIDDLLGRARALLAQSASWHDLRRRLDDAGITERLGAAALDDLLAAWHAKEAAGLSDDALAEELRFWAGGGSYGNHLKGYNATPPAVLVDEARARGWFVKPLDSGGVVVNAPSGRPLVVKLLVG